MPEPDAEPEPLALPEPDTLPEPDDGVCDLELDDPEPDMLPEPEPLPEPETLPEPDVLSLPDVAEPRASDDPPEFDDAEQPPIAMAKARAGTMASQLFRFIGIPSLVFLLTLLVTAAPPI